MKIAFLTTYDVHDQSGWPKECMGFWGAGAQIAKHLTDLSLEFDYLGPLSDSNWINVGRIARAAKTVFYDALTTKRYLKEVNLSLARHFADRASQKLAASDADIVLCAENAVPVAYLRCQQPIILWTDAPIAAEIDSYPFFSGLCSDSVRQIHVLEEAAFANCALTIYASDWAVSKAVEIYGADRAKLRVLPRGGNMVHNGGRAYVEHLIESKPFDKCRLLFIGVDWVRKGGDVALEVAEVLHRAGFDVELTVIGCKPDRQLPSFVNTTGFIDKSTTAGAKMFSELMARAHFLVLPVKAEAFGNVFSEASAFGIPSLAADAGGVRTAIRNEVNGMVFPSSCGASDYAAYIAGYIREPGLYRKLAFSSLREYETRLNWPVICTEARQILDGVRQRQASTQRYFRPGKWTNV